MTRRAARLRLPAPAAAISPAGSRPTARARSARTRRRRPRSSSPRSRTSRSRSASPAPAAASSASAAARPTSRTPRGRSRTRRRPICEGAGIDFVEFQVANDALTVVVNKDNDWVDCLTTEQLKQIWEPSSKVSSWMDLDPSFPDEPIKLFGPGTDSGTFDYFTGEINGEEGASRSDYAASEDDNTTVTGVAGEKGGLGYFGFSYFEENQDTLKALEIDGGDGCVAPSVAAAQDGTYKPLSRPLFVYATKKALARPEVEAFLRFMLDNEKSIAEASQFVPLTDRAARQGQGRPRRGRRGVVGVDRRHDGRRAPAPRPPQALRGGRRQGPARRVCADLGRDDRRDRRCALRARVRVLRRGLARRLLHGHRVGAALRAGEVRRTAADRGHAARDGDRERRRDAARARAPRSI